MRLYRFESSASDRADYIRNARLWAEECAAHDIETLREQLECIDAYVDEYVAHIAADDNGTARDFAEMAFREAFESRLAELEEENE